MKTMTTRELAQELLGYIQYHPASDDIHERGDYRLATDAPDWALRAVQAGHLGNLPVTGPADHYPVIVDVLEHILNCSDIETARDAITELEPDSYTAELTAWLASNINFVKYIDEALGVGCDDGFKLLATAQWCWKQEIAHAILSALDAQGRV